MPVGHLATTGDVDLEEQVATFVEHRGPVELAEELVPLEEASDLPPGDEGAAVDEHVGVGCLVDALRAGGPGAAQRQVRVAADQRLGDRPLARSTGSREDEQHPPGPFDRGDVVTRRGCGVRHLDQRVRVLRGSDVSRSGRATRPAAGCRVPGGGGSC